MILLQKRKGPNYRVSQQIEVVNQGRAPATDVVAKCILYTEAGISSAQAKTTPLCRKVKDNQGNNFGLFKLGTLKTKETRVLRLEVMIEPYVYRTKARYLGMLKEIEQILQQKYCGATKYWDTAPELQDTVVSVITETEDIAKILKQIFQFLNSLIFREHLTTRRGALKTLHTKYGDCDEFTDLFVTMARHVGIPARRITGLFLKAGQPVHHAWAEAFTPKWNWLPFDPALGYFAASSVNHIPRKLEATVSEIPDYGIRYKSKRTTNLSIQPIEEDPLVQIIKNAV